MSGFSITSGASGTGNGTIKVKGDQVRLGRDTTQLGSLTITAGTKTATTLVYQSGCPQHMSSEKDSVSGTGLGSRFSSADSTCSVTLYSNAKYFKIEKQGYAAGSSIYSWNSFGHNYDEDNTSNIYPDARVDKVTIAGTSQTLTSDLTFSAGTNGTDSQYPIVITFGVRENLDNVDVTRKFLVTCYGDSGDSINSVASIVITLTQPAGSVTLSATAAIYIPYTGEETDIEVTCNTAWTVDGDQ